MKMCERGWDGVKGGSVKSRERICGCVGDG